MDKGGLDHKEFIQGPVQSWAGSREAFLDKIVDLGWIEKSDLQPDAATQQYVRGVYSRNPRSNPENDPLASIRMEAVLGYAEDFQIREKVAKKFSTAVREATDENFQTMLQNAQYADLAMSVLASFRTVELLQNVEVRNPTAPAIVEVGKTIFDSIKAYETMEIEYRGKSKEEVAFQSVSPQRKQLPQALQNDVEYLRAMALEGPRILTLNLELYEQQSKLTKNQIVR